MDECGARFEFPQAIALLNKVEMRLCAVYLSSGEGFQAKIKNIPEDFIVNEVSSFTGKVEPTISCAKGREDSSEQSLKRQVEPEGEGNSTPNKRLKIPSDGENENSSRDKIDRGKCNDVDWCTCTLQNILPVETMNNLENYAQNFLAFLQAKTAEPSECNESLTIGTFSCRDERTTVHRCIRFLYPYLKTTTTAHAKDVTVRACPNYSKFETLIGHDMSCKILRFIHVEVFENLKNQMTVDGEYDKETRRKIHHLISSCFGKFMETRTLPSSRDDGHRVISIRRKAHLVKSKQTESMGTGIITAFTLWKKNCETYAAIHHIGRHLNIPHNKFNFAGIKDKRAVTKQKCTVTGISSEKFTDACKSLPKHLKVSDCHEVSRVIHLGELDVNQFCIKLTRICSLHSKEKATSLAQDIQSAIDSVQTTGFVNYFGPQRFGRHILNCYQAGGQFLSLEAPAVGLAMLQKDFERAVDILLTPTESSNIEGKDNLAKKHFQETRNIQETLDMMPSQKLREISILRTLRRHGSMNSDACTKALLGLPHSSRLLYVHSFCSYVWNEMATRRIHKYGDQVVVGDLVRSSDSSTSMEVVMVTEADVAEDAYALKDVILPVPGSQTRYPPCLESEYCEMLQKFGIKTNDVFRISPLKLYAPGAYRKLIESPKNLTKRLLPHDVSSMNGGGYQFVDDKVLYGDGSCCRVETSFDKDACGSLQEDTSDTSPSYENFDIELQFDLPPSCYATTFLSDLTKGHLL